MSLDSYFVVRTVMTDEDMRKVVRFLSSSDDGVSPSSFAVIADAGNNLKTVLLSSVSLQRIEDAVSTGNGIGISLEGLFR